MSSAATAAVLALLAQQDGLITRAQAVGLGMAERTLRRRVAGRGYGPGPVSRCGDAISTPPISSTVAACSSSTGR